jgi:hypothetical protein
MQRLCEWGEKIEEYRFIIPLPFNDQSASRWGRCGGEGNDSGNLIADTVGVLNMERDIIFVILKIELFELGDKRIDLFQTCECAANP